MTHLAYGVSLQAQPASATDAFAKGDAALWTEDGYVLATAAARTGGARSSGVVVRLGAPGGGVFLESGGDVEPMVTGLAPGVASYARVTALGRIERVAFDAAAESDDLIGTVDPSGVLHVMPGFVPGAPGPQGVPGPQGPEGPQGPPGGDGGSLPSGTGIVVGWLSGDGLTQTYQAVSGPGTPYLASDGTAAGELAVVPNGEPGQVYTAGEDGTPGWADAGGGSGGNPWAGLEDAYGIPFWNSEGEPQVFQTVGSKGVEVDDVGEIRVAGMLGSKFDASAYLEFERYNWPEGFDLAVDYAMPIGHKFAVTFGAGDGPFGPAWLWPPDSSATLDVVTSFTSGTAERRITRTYLVKRVGTGTLTVTQDGSGTPSGDALASVDVTLSVDTSPYLKLTVIPAAGATNSLTEISGHLKRRPA